MCFSCYRYIPKLNRQTIPNQVCYGCYYQFRAEWMKLRKQWKEYTADMNEHGMLSTGY